MSEDLDMAVLTRIRSWLHENPGEYYWTPRSEEWGVDLRVLYFHLRWLRESGFTRNVIARVFWVSGSLAEIRTALERSVSKPQSVIAKTDVVSTATGGCVAELKDMVFVGLSILQVQRKLSNPYTFAEIHRAVVECGGSVFCTGRGREKVYTKLS